jgi:hypothetical protein
MGKNTIFFRYNRDRSPSPPRCVDSQEHPQSTPIKTSKNEWQHILQDIQKIGKRSVQNLHNNRPMISKKMEQHRQFVEQNIDKIPNKPFSRIYNAVKVLNNKAQQAELTNKKTLDLRFYAAKASPLPKHSDTVSPKKNLTHT